MKKIKEILLCFILLVLLFSNIQSANADEYFDIYYGNISWTEEKICLDNFSIHLKLNPDHIGYIAFFVGKNDKSTTVKKRMERAKKYLTEFRKLSKNQIVIVNAGKNEETKVILHPVSKKYPPPKFGHY